MSETKFHELPILDVHKENIEEVWPLIINAIKQSTFVGLDAELSGLGKHRFHFVCTVYILVILTTSRKVMAHKQFITPN